ncbi:MAG: microcystin degradation protein MlrC [Methylibium sp. NZG]|nr:MAG: microcystin degradation protein MlrC [Methylibium sp. NZG]
MNIFVAGFHHETNTFAPSPADWAAFESGAGYAAYSRGAVMLERMQGSSLAIGGFAQAARERGWTLLPSVWAGAVPSNRVTAAAFERICAEIVDDLQQDDLDAIYLDLHGAAVAEGCDDAEGELLRRIRAVVGPNLPIVASLDLHANVTAQMLRLSSAMTAYRTYPHVDMRETGARAAQMLAHRLGDATGLTQAERHQHSERVPFLLPLNAQCTLMEPAASIIQLLERLENEHKVELNFAMGFSAADFSECGPVLFGYGPDADEVAGAVKRLYDEAVVQRRGDWALELLPPADAIEQAIALAADASGPVVIADTQDNPGAGGDSNTTGLLHALVHARAGERLGGRVALGLLFDSESARAAHAAGVGATLALSLGRSVPTWSGAMTEPPLQAQVTVLALSDGVVPLHGPMTAGMTTTLGPCACVELAGIRVLLSSAKAQMLDLDLYRFLAVEPAQMKLLVNKSSVHFRAAFAPIASHILVAKAPGPMAADPADLPWQHLPEGMARRP